MKKRVGRVPMSTGRKILFVICLIVFVGSLSKLLDQYIIGRMEQKNLESLSGMKSETEEDLLTDKGTVIGKYADLYRLNGDIIGWIRVKGTKIDYPVMQTKEDPEYYLHRSFEKKHVKSGTPFIDADSDIFTPNDNFLIYGHNMKNGNMFYDLMKYDKESFYKKHGTFFFDTIYKGGQGEYEMIAAAYSEILPKDSHRFKYYTYAALNDKDGFYEYIKGVKALSIYDTGKEAEYGDQLVTLSTCAYHTEEGRFFVVGRRTDRGKIPPLK